MRALGVVLVVALCVVGVAFIVAGALQTAAAWGEATRADLTYAAAVRSALAAGPDLGAVGADVDVAFSDPLRIRRASAVGGVGPRLLMASGKLNDQAERLRALDPPASMLIADSALLTAADVCSALAAVLRSAVDAGDPDGLIAVPGLVERYAAAVDRAAWELELALK